MALQELINAKGLKFLFDPSKVVLKGAGISNCFPS